MLAGGRTLFTKIIILTRGKNDHDMSRSRGRSISSEDGASIYFSCDDGHSSDDMSVPSSRLSVLKTKAESRALAETIKVWIVELPVKAANDILM